MPFSAEHEKSPGMPGPSAMESLDEIEHSLKQMLLLAELSASDTHVDRDWLQTVLERLRNKIDRIADQL